MRRTSKLALILWLAASPRPAASQFFARCDKGDRAELAANVRAHAQHTYRLDQKVSRYWYDNKKLPPEYEDAKLGDVEAFLRRSRERVGVLYQARDRASPKLCTWLITQRGVTAHVAPGVTAEEQAGLRDALLAVLGVPERLKGRAPEVRPDWRGVAPIPVAAVPAAEREGALKRLAARLLPPPVASSILEQKLETLVVVPHGDEGTLPYAALPIGERDGKPHLLVEEVSVLVAPGFESFRSAPARRQPSLLPAVVVGNPASPARDEKYEFPPLAGAKAEAAAVADLLRAAAGQGAGAGTVAHLDGAAARSEAILEAGRSQSARTRLVYLATHGIADAENPLDGSFLWLADGRWTARAFQAFPARDSRPLVVLSACQTGLGKRFDVGTIGMARAWQLAGARSVVMSLWSVDDAATRKLMVRFLAEAGQQPPDKALRAAMRARRAEDPDPAHWASFAVFGVAER